MDQGRTAVVLAAGQGTRLGGNLEAGIPKPLIPVEGRPVILRTLQSLEQAGCRRVIIVVGFAAERVHRTIESQYGGPLKLVFAYNAQYQLANGLSVLMARSYLDGDFLLTMADHVLDRRMMRLARDHQPPADGATLLVDHKVDSIFDLDDATKVLERDRRIVSIGKGIAEYNCIDTGVFVCTTALLEHIETLYRERGDVSLSDAVQALARSGRMSVLDVGDAFWQDVDTPEMLDHAECKLREQGLPAS